jgi:hypothetical protein
VVSREEYVLLHEADVACGWRTCSESLAEVFVHAGCTGCVVVKSGDLSNSPTAFVVVATVAF